MDYVKFDAWVVRLNKESGDNDNNIDKEIGR